MTGSSPAHRTSTFRLFAPKLLTLVTALTTAIAAAAPQAAAPQPASPITEEQLHELAAAGGNHTLPAGVITLTRPLAVSADLVLTGAGPLDTTIQYLGAGTAVRVEGGATLELWDLRIDAATPHADAPGTDLIQVLDGDLMLDSVYLSNARNDAPDDLKRYGYGSGLYVTGTSSATVILSMFQFNGLVSIEGNEGATITVQDSMFDRNIHGVYVEDGVTLTITGTEFVETVETAVNVRGGATATLAYNTFTRTGIDPATGQGTFDALRFGDSTRVTLVANHVDGSPRYALSLFGSAEVRAEGNLFTGNGGHDQEVNLFRSAILLEDESRYVGSDDEFSENPGGAFELDSTASLLMERTTFRNNASYATGWVGGNASAVLVDATFDGNQGGLWLVSDATLVVERGTFINTGRDVVDARGHSRATVIDARFADNEGAGVYVSEQAGATVRGGSFEGNLAGTVASGSAIMEVAGGSFTRNQGAGVLYLGDASGSVTANVFDGNGGLALDLRSTAAVAVEANEER